MKFRYVFFRFLFIFIIVAGHSLNSCETVDFSFQQRIDNADNFLNRNVPGLNASYNEVIDAMIQQGWDVYIRGGL